MTSYTFDNLGKKLKSLSGHIKVLAQTMFNSYLPNYTRGDFSRYFPDMPNPRRA